MKRRKKRRWKDKKFEAIVLAIKRDFPKEVKRGRINPWAIAHSVRKKKAPSLYK